MPRLPHAPALLAALFAATSLAGCALPVVLGAGAAAGYVGLQQRPAKQIAADTDLKLSIKNNLSAQKFSYMGDIGIDVFYGDVLLTGVVPTQAEGDQVLDIVRRTEGVKKVYNELFFGAAYTAAQKAKDAWISTQLQPRLIGTEDAYPLNYLITVVNSHVYVMGSVETITEKQHVLHVIRTTNGVQQVHDYLVLMPKTSDGRSNTNAQSLNSGTLRAPNPFPDDPQNP
jgi:osmotically-inducible protein OsmY